MLQLGPGEAACLAASLGWAFALAWLRAPVQEFGAWTINLGKNTLGVLLLGVTVWVGGFVPVLIEAPARSVALVAISGVFGLVLGDTALFAALSRIGLHRTLLLQSLSPVFAGALALGLYGERLTRGQYLGSLVILGGILLVVTERTSPPVSPPAIPAPAEPVVAVPEAAELSPATSSHWLGAAFGLLSAFGTGAGLVLAKDGMGELPFLPATFVRLGTAVVCLTFLLPLLGRAQALRQLSSTPKVWRRIAGPSVLGAYISLLLMMAGIAWAPASIAAVLLATPPVWALFIDAWMEKRRITLRGLGGTLLTVAGIGVLTAS